MIIEYSVDYTVQKLVNIMELFINCSRGIVWTWGSSSLLAGFVRRGTARLGDGIEFFQKRGLIITYEKKT